MDDTTDALPGASVIQHEQLNPLRTKNPSTAEPVL